MEVELKMKMKKKNKIQKNDKIIKQITNMYVVELNRPLTQKGLMK